MSPISAEIISVNIEDEMKKSYLDYAMSVIIGRAIPDVRDGLKPVHRRILYAMLREGLLSNKRFSKCAGVVGEVLKKYHPHGDMAVYDSLVRMAQSWNMRYPLIDGQGNFGSVDGDPPAAYRYTESKLTKIAEELLSDIDKETVDFVPNFDESTEEPTVLPTRVPNLLINGSDGIAVGMATKIPPHNLIEVCDAVMALIANPDMTVQEIMGIIPGPDFPTGAAIHGRTGIKEAYETGRGIIQMRAIAEIEPVKGDRENIIVTEIPYQVNKARLIERIAELVREGKIEGIGDIPDESDKDGMRIVIELKKGIVSGVVLNQLYKHTAMQSSFGVIMLAIVGNQPKILNIKSFLQLFIDHRKEVVIRRTVYELRKAQERAHILEGFKIALDHLDEVIALIRRSKNPQEAKEGLIQNYQMSEIQAQAILEMRLQRLTALERDKIIQEYEEVMALIEHLKGILNSEKKIFEIIVNETRDIRDRFGDARRTQIQVQTQDLTIEDLIAEEDMVVTISHGGYIKRNPINLYQAQKRGGQGKMGMTTSDEDFVENLFIASTHSYLLIFTNHGKVHWVKVYDIPLAGRATKGKSVANLIQMASTEKMAAVLAVKEFEAGKFVIFATKKGVVKKTDLTAFDNRRVGGIIALGVVVGDELIEVALTDGQSSVLLSTKEGQSIRFNESEVRSMGRLAHGVTGIRLDENDHVVSMEVLKERATLLTVTENGFGKRTDTDEYRVQGRGGSGIITVKTTDRNGSVVGVRKVTDDDDIMIISDGGKIIRLKVKSISVIGRNTQGVRLIQLGNNEKVVAFAKLAEKEEGDETQNTPPVEPVA
ncbi:MAG: DNA gyrase subunit A [Deltaproteobacteria bacterium]|nr:MAG: DNA gyrase subunit A [Deltaproteobacteria bacterium]